MGPNFLCYCLFSSNTDVKRAGEVVTSIRVDQLDINLCISALPAKYLHSMNDIDDDALSWYEHILN